MLQLVEQTKKLNNRNKKKKATKITFDEEDD